MPCASMDEKHINSEDENKKDYFQSYDDFEVIYDVSYPRLLSNTKYAIKFCVIPSSDLIDICNLNLKVHRLMLEDRPRTLAYKNAIEANDAVKNKIVLGIT